MCLSGLSFNQVIGFGAGTKQEGGWVSLHTCLFPPTPRRKSGRRFSLHNPSSPQLFSFCAWSEAQLSQWAASPVLKPAESEVSAGEGTGRERQPAPHFPAPPPPAWSPQEVMQSDSWVLGAGRGRETLGLVRHLNELRIRALEEGALEEGCFPGGAPANLKKVKETAGEWLQEQRCAREGQVLRAAGMVPGLRAQERHGGGSHVAARLPWL